MQIKRFVLMVLFTASLNAQTVNSPNLHKFYVECPAFKDTIYAAVMAKDRLWAMVGIGCTVFTESEWREAVKANLKFGLPEMKVKVNDLTGRESVSP